MLLFSNKGLLEDLVLPFFTEGLALSFFDKGLLEDLTFPFFDKGLPGDLTPSFLFEPCLTTLFFAMWKSYSFKMNIRRRIRA